MFSGQKISQKAIQKVGAAGILLLGAVAACLPLFSTVAMAQISNVPVAQSTAEQTVWPVKVHFSSTEFPPAPFGQIPSPPLAETAFYEALVRDTQDSGYVSLMETPHLANYRAELRCAGVFHCSQLKLDLFTPDRKALATYNLPGRRFPWSQVDVEATAQTITDALLLFTGAPVKQADDEESEDEAQEVESGDEAGDN